MSSWFDVNQLRLVSPELQGYPLESIAGFLPLGGEVDAVCTKDPGRWTIRGSGHGA